MLRKLRRHQDLLLSSIITFLGGGLCVISEFPDERISPDGVSFRGISLQAAPRTSVDKQFSCLQRTHVGLPKKQRYTASLRIAILRDRRARLGLEVVMKHDRNGGGGWRNISSFSEFSSARSLRGIADGMVADCSTASNPAPPNGLLHLSPLQAARSLLCSAAQPQSPSCSASGITALS